MAFSVEHIGPASLRVLDAGELVCEVHDLRLRNARFRRGGRVLIGEEVPLPLYWEQYANHEDPERNAGSHGAVRTLLSNPRHVVLECTGATRSGSVRSRYTVSLSRSGAGDEYQYEIQAALRVADGSSWRVTPNPHHGELEFCNLWPDGVFAADLRKPLLYDACYVERPASVEMIPHDHFESPDKQNIHLSSGDRMMWLLEDENLCVELLSGSRVTAGLCAYMWDVHLACRVCDDGKGLLLPAAADHTAGFRLTALGRDEGKALAGRAKRPLYWTGAPPPVLLDGVQTFSENFLPGQTGRTDTWPWEHEVLSGDEGSVRFSVDSKEGLDDLASLRIDAEKGAHAAWKVTTLGPAFRQPPFRGGMRFRLVAYVRARLDSGYASLAIRLHREGAAGLFDPSTYEVYRSAESTRGESPWTRIEVATPPIHPAPDRLHLFLEMGGTGICWFDNVSFERLQ